ncbi:MAG: hypothetical protein KDB07_05935, partial [Planctomycetes bacterium]|nr:hypothetical protein [Planctomycetota bacterium]
MNAKVLALLIPLILLLGFGVFLLQDEDLPSPTPDEAPQAATHTDLPDQPAPEKSDPRKTRRERVNEKRNDEATPVRRRTSGGTMMEFSGSVSDAEGL